MLRLALLALALLPALALAQLPSYTLIDFGPDDDPNGPGPRSADCLATPDGTDGGGNPLYQCRSWDFETAVSTEFTNIWVGYAQLPPGSLQTPDLSRTPVENLDSCCGLPPPNEGLEVLPMPPGESYGAEATSLSEGGGYIVGHATHLVTSSAGNAVLRRAIVWANLTPYALPALAGNDIAFDSAAYAASPSGEVVGESQMYLNVGGYALRATIWINRAPHELQYMLSPAGNVVLTTARWIDCAGNIVAQGWPTSLGSFPPLSTSYPHDYLLVRQGSSRAGCGN